MKTATLCFLLLFTCLTTSADDLEPAVKHALKSIHTVTGESALNRMRSCGISFSDGSWIEKADYDQPTIEAHKGDLILEVYINVPPMPTDQQTYIYNDLLARWVIRKGQSIPESGWAKWIQNKPRPLQSISWMNC